MSACPFHPGGHTTAAKRNPGVLSQSQAGILQLLCYIAALTGGLQSFDMPVKPCIIAIAG